MRLFIALPVTAAARRRMENAQAALRRAGVVGRFTPPENLHMTLVFLGGVADPAPAAGILRRSPPPRSSLAFDRLTLFGDALVALYRPDDALTQYVRSLRAALDDAGLSYDRQAFRPHITLCRKTSLPSADVRLRSFEAPLGSARLPVREARLMASDLSGGTPVYTVIGSCRSATNSFPPY